MPPVDGAPGALEKVYEPQRFEPHWAAWWIDSGIYSVDAASARTGHTFSLVIPPPNVTGSLHIGHMLDHTIMDVAIRWHRMRGETTLWLPGTDHAGIATQMVVERQLAKENLTRRQLGREEFERRVWQWKEEYGGRINTQIRREGASVDWSRERFTMDPGLSRAVREAFVRLYEKGLIYRGEYMVNWCPRCQTAISDVETSHEAVPGHLWHIRYSITGTGEFLTVATTRPETMLGDTAVMVHPDDPRYKHLHGQTVTLPIMQREIPILPDAMVDPSFGTGVVKVTPAHDPNDFEAGKRHNLPLIKVIGEDARMTAAAGAYSGLDRFEARKRVITALQEAGFLDKVEDYTVNISKCDRCKTVVEPLVSMQWFISTKPLAEKAMQAVRSGQIRFVPDDREVVFFQWMENIRDWCISRQLWWGHRIPAWHCRHCSRTTVARDTQETCPHCHSTQIDQDSDVLDTWFSSSLWPFSTLGWPEDTLDLRTFYPTSLLITGFDILFFWVSRMIMLGIEMTGQVPFREVHMHGLVRDADGKKMSKTKGNVVDPLEIMDRFGTDACRIGLLLSAAPGSDIALKEDRLDSSRAFANKLWNASRLLFMNLERSAVTSWNRGVFPTSYIEDVWIYAGLSRTAATVNEALEQHRYHEAAHEIWHFVWHEFCDWYLEVKKLRFSEASGEDDHWTAALNVYETSLRLLHPFMPFVTEELWQRLVQTLPAPGHQQSISLESFPAQFLAPAAKADPFVLLQEIVKDAREQRASRKLESKAELAAVLTLKSYEFSTADLALIAKLGRLNVRQENAPQLETSFELAIEAAAQGQNGALSPDARARIEKESIALQRNIDNTDRQLNDPAFTSKAPERIIASMREKLAAYQALLEKNRRSLEPPPNGNV